MKNLPPRTTLLVLTAIIGLCCILFSAILVFRFSDEIRSRFDGRRWSLPAVVYARPLELYVGRRLSPQLLIEELQLCGYRNETGEDVAGSYSVDGTTIRMMTRGFHFPSGYEPPRHLAVVFAQGQISSLRDADDHSAVGVARLDPARIGSFHPVVHEDRLILRRKEIPDLLIATLLEIEDRKFFAHHGISPVAIGRAMVANLRAGRTVQGGSTLTQQLVKNLFLTREQTLARKAKEALMALLLEYHYSKDAILTAYINEVFLGQDGNRAVHGFALASQFYFRRNLADLRADQIALLVGMIKGPSYYDPRRNPQNCLKRRNLILQRQAAIGLIDQATLSDSLARPLIEFAPQKGGFNRYPAFLDLVRRQLATEYREEDLTTDGLQILTTLDPLVQNQVEQQLRTTIDSLAKRIQQDELQGAVVVTSRETGEVLAVAGGKDGRQHGFNRALEAKRHIGSLIKPAVYLTALQQGYTLASPLLDSAIQVPSGPQTVWQPENYDHREHGRVPLYMALAHSYNLATVRLGMEVGIDRVIATLGELGADDKLPAYPSLLLGAVSMSPVEVCQLYQTIASGGFYTSLKAINFVMDTDHKLLNRYGLAVEQRVPPTLNYLLSHALQRVVSEGTGRALLRSPLRGHSIAGKTGTSDKLRDSWFAGFTGDHLAVVWLGRDDNASSLLTGSTGALRVWQGIMEAIHSAPLTLIEPAGITWHRIDLDTLRPTHPLNRNSALLPFVSTTTEGPGSTSTRQSDTLGKKTRKIVDTLSDWLEKQQRP